MQPNARISTSNESKRSMIVMLDTSRCMAIEDPRTAASDVEEAAKALGKPKRQSKFSDGPAPKRPRDGGALRCWIKGREPFDVAPVGGRLVIFDSGAVEHAVLAASADRVALTVWINRE